MCFEVGINREEVVLRMAPDAAMLFAVEESLRNRVRLSSFSIVVCAVCACAASLWAGIWRAIVGAVIIQHVNRKAISSQEQQPSENSSCHNYLCSTEWVRLFWFVYIADINVRLAQVLHF